MRSPPTLARLMNHRNSYLLRRRRRSIANGDSASSIQTCHGIAASSIRVVPCVHLLALGKIFYSNMRAREHATSKTLLTVRSTMLYIHYIPSCTCRIRLRRPHAVCSWGLLPQMLHAAWSVCLCVGHRAKRSTKRNVVWMKLQSCFLYASRLSFSSIFDVWRFLPVHVFSVFSRYIL